MKFFLTVFFLIFLFIGNAQKQTIKVSENILLSTDVDLDFLLEKHKEKNEKASKKEGYRIQILYSINRSEVQNIKAEVYKNFTQFKSYLIYEQPYYKLRVGDFNTKLEARKYLGEMQKEFPTAIIVKDMIKIN